MVKLNIFKKKERQTQKAVPKVANPEASKQVTPPSSPRGRQKEREESTSPTDRHLRSHAPARNLSKSAVKSDRDLYNDLLEEATGGTQHTCSTSNSSLEFDGNNSSRFTVELELPDIAATSPGKASKKVIVDSLQQIRPKSPGHTGHERRQKFTFVGEMLEDEDADEAEEFGEEEAVLDFIGSTYVHPPNATESPQKLKALRPANQQKKTSPSKTGGSHPGPRSTPKKPKAVCPAEQSKKATAKKPNAARCDAV